MVAMTVMLYRLSLPLSFEWEALVSAFYWENLNRRGLNGVISLAASLGVHHETRRHVTWCSISALFSYIEKLIRDWENGDQGFCLFSFLFGLTFFFSPT